MPRKFKKELNFDFVFPSIQGEYYHSDGTIYIFGEWYEGDIADDITDLINEAVVDHTIKKVNGKKASLEFQFRYPSTEFYDFNDGTDSIFGEQSIREIIENMEHGAIHYALQKVTGKRVSCKFDRIYPKLYKTKKLEIKKD